MKQLIIIILFLIPAVAWGQTDSSKIYVKNITFLAGDVGSLGVLSYSMDEIYDDLRRQSEKKVSELPNITLATPVTLDSLSVETLLSISRWIRASEYAQTSQFFNRVNNVIKALPNTYLQGEITRMDARIQTSYTSNRNYYLKRFANLKN